MNNESNLVLTPSGLLAFLSQIEELEGYELKLVEDEDTIRIHIGDSIYSIESPESSEVEVSDEVVDVIDDLNAEGYHELEEDEGIDVEDFEDIEGEAVEGGIIKELIKTLAVGGLVRLTKDAIMKS